MKSYYNNPVNRKLSKTTPSKIRLWLSVILFPWFIWNVCSYFPKAFKKRFGRTRLKIRILGTFGHILLYGLIGFPLTIYLTGEWLIALNEVIIGEGADYRYQMGSYDPDLNNNVDLPGPKSVTLETVSPSRGEAYHRYLVELYSPVILQKLSHHPEWDIPVFIDFDNNLDPRDNVLNEKKFRPHHAGVYGEMTAETEDSYYLTYSLFHLKDYDHPVREVISDWTFHDNDNEGFKIRVDKKTMRVVQAECWFHNRFFLCNQTGESQGTEPIQGLTYFEKETHIIIYAQPMGHGVRCAQDFDFKNIDKNTKILRYRGERPPVPTIADRTIQINTTYDIKNFDTWYEYALGPLGTQGMGKGMFEEEIIMGTHKDGRRIAIGRYIAGWDYAKGSWARPKPPWSWDDGWDNIPNTIWHFYPSYAFESHFGTELSHRYLSNRPVEKTFSMSADAFYPHLKMEITYRRGLKWQGIERRGDRPRRKDYKQAMLLLLKRYINYLFNALG